MPCDTQRTPGQSLAERMTQVKAALRRLELALASGSSRIVIAQNGAVAFAGWQDRDGVTDVCAYRTLAAENSPVLRQAVARAELLSGRKVNPQAVAGGWHSHDNGKTWSTH
jgi:hypothetical protein